MLNLLFLAHVDESGTVLPKAAFEALGATLDFAQPLQAALTIGLIGETVQTAANSIAAVKASRIVAVSGADFKHPRYSSDAAALEAICRDAGADIVIAPATSRFLRVVPGVAQRMKGCVDTHLTAIEVRDGAPATTRWFYRQRLEGVIQRERRPWFLLLDPGGRAPWQGLPGNASVQNIELLLPPEAKRTAFSAIRTPPTDAQTIRPDAKLLFVAGAGWTKKQADGKTHLPEAEKLILGFLRNSGASLGGSKSLVDQKGEDQAVLGFMTHLNQVGQTGSTPRHPKGLSTCCHGEEPHVVGWRFINERRAVNLDPNCGWARGKADVLYVADAFQVMERLNALLAQKKEREENAVAVG
ncbi:MAG TPA: electron transfer flavoprotein subunit alpha [Verrucomicrobiae bacterium]|nr:electron transfer flavoprotein subunit alpha [Verrucomicrobiae bacterium]